MQTLRKRTSPCKYKNDPSRFLGEGITFKAKLIGILEVSEARGDKMCQDALNDLKTAIRAAGEHKQRITISISIDGLKLRDEKTGDCLYHHPVHKISFIAQDMSDSRAFGYIFGSPDTGHRFFGIKTDKTASQVVISMRDLFQVVFELKKKEIEMAKHHTEHHHSKYGSTGYLDSLHFSKNNNESEKGKAKYSQIMKSKCLPTKGNESFAATDLRGAAAEAIADLLDLEHELNNIQQGISQMEKITPSDPFGPLSKGDSYDPFDDSFSSKMEQPLEEKNSFIAKPHIPTEDTKEIEKNFLSSIAAEKTNFFPQFSPTKNKAKVEEDKWFEQERETFFEESSHVSDVEFTTSSAVLNNSGSATEQGDGRRSPLKIDLFTELDPLGTGRVKPYVDKKDFFQELKNPPKKLLKEMIVDTSSTEVSVLYFPAQHREKTNSMAKSDGHVQAVDAGHISKEPTFQKNYTNIDPFEDGDPFEKTDPFQEGNFLTSEAFALFGPKTSTSDNFDEKSSWKFDEVKDSGEEMFDKDFSATPPLFSSGALKVSLPPENFEIKPFGASSKICKLKSPPNSPEHSQTISGQIGQILKQNKLEKNEEIAIPSINSKANNFESKFEVDNFSNNIKFFTGSRTIDKIRSSNETLDPTTPDPPPRAKAALFSIKPPPLPPKKQIQLVTKPPARPPSSEDSLSHYDYLKQKEVSKNDPDVKEELRCVKLKQQLFSAKDLFPKEQKKKTAESGFPVLPPPPLQKKISHDSSKRNINRKDEREKEGDDSTIENEGSVLNIKLRQLDKTGLENLAVTLGIPLENIYCMTLQDLTKMLADKYLPSSSKKEENKINESFEVDFESNFGNACSKEENAAYDKYAVFKELIKSDNELEQTDFHKTNKSDACTLKESGNRKGEVPQEEDKYAALRLLSLNSQSNQFSADDDEDDYTAAPKTDKICDSNSSTEKLAFHGKDLKSEAGLRSFDSKTEKSEEKLVKNGEDESLARIKSPGFDTEGKTNFANENLLFRAKDDHCNENNTCLDRNNWATFDKLNFEETITKKSSDLFEENENSPFSSDGKEELREIPFCWHENDFSKKSSKDVPWRDEDESWEEDYSPKESFCSDESSREEHSPKGRRDDMYIKQRHKRGVCAKTSRNKNSKNNHWSHRDKWPEETEDEFEGSWTKQRGKTSSYDLERKNAWRGNNREECNKHCDWGNSRDGSRADDKRHSHHYVNRCKRSESDNEYRKRCDSDTSEKEYAWTFRKNYSEGHGRSEKTKQYHSSDFPFRDCPEYCHKSRSKQRRGAFQKRPNSASESKRNSEKSYFSPGHSIRDGDKTYPGKKESNINDFFKCDHDFKDSRYADEAGFKRFCSHDRKELSHHSKSCCRNSRRPSGEIYSPLGNRFDASDVQNEDYRQFYESKYDKANDEHFNYDGEIENFGSSSRTDCQAFVKSSERRQKLLNSKNEKISGADDNGFFPFTNNTDSMPGFKGSTAKSDGKSEGVLGDSKKTQGKTQLTDPEFQGSSSSSTLRKSDSINIFSRDKDPFEGDDFFNSVS